MPSYRLSPFVGFIESHLIAAASQYAVFHRLTGEIVEPGPSVLSLLHAMKMGSGVTCEGPDLEALGEDGRQISKLIDKEFLMPIEHDALSSFVDYYVVRPLQNPAITFQSETGAVVLVRMSMAERVYSPQRGKLPPIFEETISPLATKLLLAAEGTKNARTAASAATAPHERFLVTSSPCSVSLPPGVIPGGAKNQTAYDRVRTTASVLAPPQPPTVFSLKKPANPFPLK